MTSLGGDVDVVVVTHNSARSIASCLKSLEGNVRIGSIVVVDNASTDDTLQFVDLPVRWLQSGVNLGFGTGANRGAAVSRRPYICFLNPDLEARGRAIDLLAQQLDLDETTAIVGPTVLDPNGSLYPSARSFPRPLTAVGHAFVGLLWHENPWSRRYRQTDAEHPDWVSGTALVVRRDVFESLGGFDEGYFMYVEDLDLCWRARQLGHRVGFCEESVVVHEVGGSSVAAPTKTRRTLLVAHHRSAWRFARKSTSGNSRLMLPLYGLAIAGRLAFSLLAKKFRPE